MAEGINLANGFKLTVIHTGQGAGQGDVNGTRVNMANWQGVIFITTFGAITGGAATTVKVQQADGAGAGSGDDLLGTAITVADDDDNKAFIHDIYRPGDLYVGPVVTRANEDSVVKEILAIQYGPRKKPTTQDADTVGGIETHRSPIESTA